MLRDFYTVSSDLTAKQTSQAHLLLRAPFPAIFVTLKHTCETAERLVQAAICPTWPILTLEKALAKANTYSQTTTNTALLLALFLQLPVCKMSYTKDLFRKSQHINAV